MNFTGEVTLGNLLTMVAFIGGAIGAFYGLKSKLDVFATLIEQHNANVKSMEARHEQRLTRLEDNEKKLTQMVQQLIGQNEERVRWDGLERRHGNEPRRR